MQPISRRTAMKTSAAAAAGLVAAPAKLWAKSLATSTGIQLYTVNQELAQDLPGTLDKLAAIGYRRVESAGWRERAQRSFARRWTRRG